MSTCASSATLQQAVHFLVLGFVAGSCLEHDAQAQERGKPRIDYREPSRDYVEMKVEERTFHVEMELVSEDPDLTQKVLARLNERIKDAIAIFPEHSRAGLEDMPFFVMYGEKATHGGRRSGMAYFRKEAPKHRKDIDARWGRSIVIYSAENYFKLRDIWATKSIVHELAHAYHLEHWPEKEDAIVAAWEGAMERGLYHGVKNDKGEVLDKAYATVNQLEYFAELTCMYFVRCDYHPFDRRQLAAYDPTGYAMIEKYWNVPKLATEHELRTWTDNTGKFTVKAKFKSYASGKVTLAKDDGSEIIVPASKLSDPDRSYLAKLKRGN